MLGNRVRLLAGLTAALAIAASAAQAIPTRLSYRVTHSAYGAIGTYTNIVDKVGNTTTVKTEGRISVGLAGIVLYRQEADRTERWVDGRLMSFEGTTKTNGKSPVAVSGAAEGDHFVVKSDAGAQTAPADVHPANPWSRDVLKGDTLFTPDRGAIEHVQIAAGEDEDVDIEGRNVRAKHYRIERGGGRKYDVWLDAQDTVVKFAMVNPNNTVSFTLDR